MAFINQDAFSSYLMGAGGEDWSLNLVDFSENRSPISPLILPLPQNGEVKWPTEELPCAEVQVASEPSKQYESAMCEAAGIPLLPGEAVSDTVTSKSVTNALKRKTPEAKVTTEVLTTKVRKQKERNRLSARRNRGRKKQYLQELELTVKILKQQLDEAKRKLVKYELNSKMQCTLLQDSISQTRPQMNQMLDKMLHAYKQHDEVSAGIAVHNLNMMHGAYLEECKRMAEIFMKRIIELVLPTSHKYSLWAAEHNSGHYNIMNMCTNLDHTWERKEKDEWDTVVDYVKLSEEAFQTYYKTKEFMLEHVVTIRQKIKNILKAKDEVFEESIAIDNYIQQNILQKMPMADMGGFAMWFDKMKNKPELSDNSFYKLTKEDFNGVEPEHIHPPGNSHSVITEVAAKRRPLSFQ